MGGCAGPGSLPSQILLRLLAVRAEWIGVDARLAHGADGGSREGRGRVLAGDACAAPPSSSPARGDGGRVECDAGAGREGGCDAVRLRWRGRVTAWGRGRGGMGERWRRGSEEREGVARGREREREGKEESRWRERGEGR